MAMYISCKRGITWKMTICGTSNYHEHIKVYISQSHSQIIQLMVAPLTCVNDVMMLSLVVICHPLVVHDRLVASGYLMQLDSRAGGMFRESRYHCMSDIKAPPSVEVQHLP